jgi:hypothetical protein
MTLKSACSLFTATVKHQLRGTALALLALTFLATGSLKAQNCPLSSYTILPASWSYSWMGTTNGSVTVSAPAGCWWTLIKEAYSGNSPGGGNRVA